MARPLIADVGGESAPMLLAQLRGEGFEICVEGDRLRIRPADRLTPALREALARRKPEFLALLAPVTEFVSLRGGLTVPRPALELALDLEARGLPLQTTPTGEFMIPTDPTLTEADRAGLVRWRRHLAALADYRAPEVG